MPTDEALWRKQRKRREAGPPREAFGAPKKRSRCLFTIAARATHFFATKNKINIKSIKSKDLYNGLA